MAGRRRSRRQRRARRRRTANARGRTQAADAAAGRLSRHDALPRRDPVRSPAVLSHGRSPMHRTWVTKGVVAMLLAVAAGAVAVTKDVSAQTEASRLLTGKKSNK